MRKLMMVVIASLVIVLAACQTTTTSNTTTTTATTAKTTASDAQLQEAADGLTLSFTEVNGDVTLPITGKNGSKVSWISNNPAVLTNTGKYTKPNLDTNVKLIAVVAIDDKQTTKDFVVKAIGKTMDVRLDEAKADLKLDFKEAKGHITLPTKGIQLSTVTWTSNDETVIKIVETKDAKGVITKITGQFTSPAEDKDIILTATIKIVDSETVNKTITKEITIKAKKLTDAEKLVQAKDDFALTGDLTKVKANLTLAATAKYGATVTWVSSNTAVLGNDGVVTLPTVDTKVKLVGFFKLGTVTEVRVFDVTVLKAETPAQ